MPAAIKPIFLLGLPGSGKTTVGKLLSIRLDIPFVDLDDLIVQSEQREISDVFREWGEEYFRKVESECLHSIIDSKKCQIVSTGGGTPCFFDNLEKMNNAGRTCYLETSWAALALRVPPGGNTRPLFKGLTSVDVESQLMEKFSWRLPYYERALWTVRTTEKDAVQIAEEILGYL